MNEQNNEELTKSLIALIDETLEEIEELKKSSKFSATEIKLDGPGEEIDGKPTNGSLEAKKAEKDEDDEDEDDEDEDKKKVEKKEKDEDEDEDDEDEKEVKKSEDEKESKKEKKEQKEEKEIKKSETPVVEELMKSYFDNRIAPIESKINDLIATVGKIVDMPVERKGVPAGIQALKKSEDAPATLSKAYVANKLFELKKSGEKVDTLDLIKVETGSMADAAVVANRYNIK